jgi:hypothetical protein
MATYWLGLEETELERRVFAERQLRPDPHGNDRPLCASQHRCRGSRQLGQNARAKKRDFHCLGRLGMSLMLVVRAAAIRRACSFRTSSDSPPGLRHQNADDVVSIVILLSATERPLCGLH